MTNDTTTLFDLSEINDKVVNEVLIDVYNSLEERGYNSINQLVGYLMSGDLGYITSYKNARQKIMQFDRTKILEALVKLCADKWEY